MPLNWNRRKINEILGTNSKAIYWSEQNGYILKEKLCRTHRKPMSIELTHGKVGRFRCRIGDCLNRNQVSRAKNTWFDMTKINMPAIFDLMYSFAREESYENAINEAANHDETVRSSPNTVADWYEN